MSLLGRGQALRTLVYHRVGDAAVPFPELSPRLINAAPAVFERQLQYIARRYQPIDATELLSALDGRHTLPPRAVLVTFDDGYRDFQQIAWPIIRRHHISPVLFVPTAFVGQPASLFWWETIWQAVSRTAEPWVEVQPAPRLALTSWDERLAAADQLTEWLKTLTPKRRLAAVEDLQRRLRVLPEPGQTLLGWEELRQLAREGVTIAAHSRTHELLNQIEADALVKEVDGCRDDLVRELGSCPPLFAYPNGSFSHRSIQALAAAGFRAGFTTLHGISRLVDSSSHLTLRRDDGGVSLAKLRLNLLGPVGAARAWRHPIRRGLG